MTQRNILFVTHRFFFPPSHSPPFSIIKRGQPSINPAITHAITLTIRLSLICVICYMNVEGAPAGKGFTLLALVLHSLFTVCFWNRCGRIQEGQQSLLTAVWFGKRGGKKKEKKKSTVQGHFLKLHYSVLLNLTATPLYSEKINHLIRLQTKWLPPGRPTARQQFSSSFQHRDLECLIKSKNFPQWKKTKRKHKRNCLHFWWCRCNTECLCMLNK